jgi:hypothetical protein
LCVSAHGQTVDKLSQTAPGFTCNYQPQYHDQLLCYAHLLDAEGNYVGSMTVALYSFDARSGSGVLSIGDASGAPLWTSTTFSWQASAGTYTQTAVFNYPGGSGTLDLDIIQVTKCWRNRCTSNRQLVGGELNY